MGHFSGFSRQTTEFLRSLSRNNNKAWFESHRDAYRSHLLEPFQNLVLDLNEFMYAIDPEFEFSPMINKTISRIYRDTRFSKDKSPYKTAMWLTYKRANKEWMDAPVYFFELGTDLYRYGMGYYSAPKATMDRFRAAIDNNQGKFKRLISLIEKQDIFSVEGEQYKKILNAELSTKIQDWYQRKNLYFICNRKIDSRVFSSRLVVDLAAGFKLLAPFYYFLRDLKK